MGGRRVLWGLSFDATPISGVVVEFVKAAAVFAGRGYAVHLDLGYDVKADKGRFFTGPGEAGDVLPAWVRLDQVPDLNSVEGYDQDFVRRVLHEVVRTGTGPPGLLSEVERISDELALRIEQTWEDRGVDLVLVENGTLPENITYTKALYKAIARYGERHDLGRFVLWRDHDMMWQSEPGTGKYGRFPYPATPKPRDSPHLHYLALHEHALGKTLEWVPELRNISVLPNTFHHARAEITGANAGFRAQFGLPPDALLLARFTRIIPQKRIDRDLHLLAMLARDLDVVLFVAGGVTEAPGEHRRLCALARRLGVEDRVVFGGRLAPHDAGGPGWSVRDLLAHADLALFLTSYDYESYGNPVGEAIASGTPFAASHYELYDTVYGAKGFQAPLLDVRAHDLPTEEFAAEVAALLTDPAARAGVVETNYRIGMRHFGHSRVEETMDELVPEPMGERTRLSVVLPVYNEAADLWQVLESLRDQRGPGGAPLDRELYEIVLVDNNSTDDTAAIARRFARAHPDLAVHVITEPEQGVSCARRAGMDFAALRSTARPFADLDERCYLVSADADCRVDPDWLWRLFDAMESTKAAIGVCDYYYTAAHFAGRPRLWDAIQKTLRCRAVAFTLFGGFPDGKGFAVDRDAYLAVGGIEIFYQLRDGKFVNHLSDDWDFGIKVRGSGYDITYAPHSRVEINPRRVNHALDEVITGRAYGSGGTIVMRDIRVEDPAPERDSDLTAAEALQAWEFSVKDFTPKNLVLPVLLTPALLEDPDVLAFFGADLARRLGDRIAALKTEMRLLDFTPIHAYKTPSFRLYFEFADELFGCLRRAVGEDIGYPPPLPDCFADVPADRFTEFVHYYCEDRESGVAHDYFGNGGVF